MESVKYFFNDLVRKNCDQEPEPVALPRPEPDNQTGSAELLAIMKDNLTLTITRHTFLSNEGNFSTKRPKGHFSNLW